MKAAGGSAIPTLVTAWHDSLFQPITVVLEPGEEPDEEQVVYVNGRNNLLPSERKELDKFRSCPTERIHLRLYRMFLEALDVVIVAVEAEKR